jgi:hypothetical protein
MLIHSNRYLCCFVILLWYKWHLQTPDNFFANIKRYVVIIRYILEKHENALIKIILNKKNKIPFAFADSSRMTD